MRPIKMPETQISLFMTVLFCSVLMKAFGGGVISIKLIHFENTLNRLPDGTCCDGWSTSKGKCHTCEYFFTFCISDINNTACSLKQMTTDIMSWTEYYAFEEFLFLAPYGDEIKNPIQLQFTSWNGGMEFGVKAFDQDDRGTSQLISNFKQNITINATRNGIKPSVNSVLLQGKVRPVGGTIPKLTAEISVSCDANYLIPKCSDLCIDTNDATGHYKCNYVKGTRECLQGWYGERCNKKVALCTPRNDTLGHYKCNSATGEKICLPGWKNATTHCTEAILPSRSTAIKPSSSIKNQKITPSVMQITSESQITSITSTLTILADTTSMVPINAITLAPMTSITPSLKHIPIITQKESKTMIPSIIASSSKSVTSINPSLNAPETITTKLSQTAISPITATISTPIASISSSSKTSTTVTSKRSNTLVAVHSLRSSDWSTKRTIKTTTLTKHPSENSHTPVTNTILRFILNSMSLNARKSVTLQRTMTPQDTKDKMLASTIRTPKRQTVDHKSMFVPTTPTSKESGKKKFFDLTKISAFVVAIGLLLILMFLVFVLLVRKQRKRRVQPFTFSEKYQHNSSRIISSRNSKCTDSSMPSIRGMAETRFGSNNDVSMKEIEKRCINSSVSGRQMNFDRSDGVSHLSINQQNNGSMKRSSETLSNKPETTSFNFLVIPDRYTSKQGITL